MEFAPGEFFYIYVHLIVKPERPEGLFLFLFTRISFRFGTRLRRGTRIALITRIHTNFKNMGRGLILFEKA